MNIYLDIDGTIITKDKKPAKKLKEFLSKLLKIGDVYWLTTHCRESSVEPVLRYLQPVLNDELMNLVKQIKPTAWNTLKTEAIDFSKPFAWFDDYLMYSEKAILEKNKSVESWIEVVLNIDDDIHSYIKYIDARKNNHIYDLGEITYKSGNIERTLQVTAQSTILSKVDEVIAKKSLERVYKMIFKKMGLG